MSSNKTAHVKLLLTDQPSRMEIVYQQHKEIRVVLSQTEVVRQINCALLQDFVYAVRGFTVDEFVASNSIPTHIKQLFYSFCEPTRVPYNEVEQKRPVAPVDNGRRAINSIVENIASLNNLINRPTNSSLLRFLSNDSPVLSATDAFYMPDVMGMPSILHPAVPRLSNTILPSSTQGSVASSSTSLAMPSVVNHSPALTARSPYVDQPSENRTLDQKNHDVELPPRFVPNDTSIREIIFTHPPASQTSHGNDEKHVDAKDSINLPHQTALETLQNQRNALSDDTIKRLAHVIYNLLNNSSLKHPDFSNKTRNGYRKIKNFIHNITHTYLSNEEIDRFVICLESIDTAHDSD